MLDHAGILALLGERGISVAGSIVEDTGTSKHIFIHVEVSRDPDNKQVPSNQKLKDASQYLASMGIIVEFLLTDAHHQDIEAGLRATMLHAFGNDIRNAFMSVVKNEAQVWLEPKRTLDKKMSDAIHKKLKTYLKEFFGIELGSLVMTSDANLPSNLAVLRAVRYLAPVDRPCLLRELVNRGFTVPSMDWLRRRLDAMRRKDQIVRLEGDRYAVSLKNIRSLGTVKGRESPDIARLLALAKRGMR